MTIAAHIKYIHMLSNEDASESNRIGNRFAQDFTDLEAEVKKDCPNNNKIRVCF